MTRMIHACALLVLGPAPGWAALDPEADQPYRLEVVLHIAEHPVLTPVFKDRVERELGDSLQGALGDLAAVRVSRPDPRKEARLQQVLARGLGPALDNLHEVSDVKTHFVLIDYVDGQYQIQARQYDGLTGQPSPAVRIERTPYREMVARAAALLVDHDFGLVGTIVDRADGQSLRVALKGGSLGVPLEEWLQPGEVFDLVQIARTAGVLRATPVPWALLRVEQTARDGVCLCRLFHRHPRPLAEGPGVLGYRCLKLGTTRSPLRLRLVEALARTPTALANVQVQVRHHGFNGKEPDMVEGVTDLDGYFRTDRETDAGQTYEHVAFVSVQSGGRLHAQIPVALVDDRVVVCPVSVREDTLADLRVQRDLWVQQLYESVLVLADLFKKLKEMVGKPEQRAAALALAQDRVKTLEDDLSQFRHRRDDLHRAAGDQLDLNEGEQRLQELRKDREELHRFIAGLDKIVKEENDPKRKDLQALVQQAHLLEGEAEFGRAIELYTQALAGGLDDPALRKHLASLKSRWQTKHVAHAEARRFIYRVWPGLDLPGVRVRMKEAQQALETCRQAGDMLSPQKLLQGAIAHVARLKQELGALHPERNADDQKKAQTLTEVSEGLNKLIKETTAYLEQKANAQ